MCNYEKLKSVGLQWTLPSCCVRLWSSLCLLLGLTATVAFATPTPIVETPQLIMHEAGVRALFEKARVRQSLVMGRNLSLSSLQTYPQRYKILTSQLKDRVISAAVDQALPSQALNQILARLLNGAGLSEALESKTQTAVVANAATQLAERFKTDEETIKAVVFQQWRKQIFIDLLVSKLPPGYMLVYWFERELELEFSAITVPRVPTTYEINRAVKRYAEEIATRYNRQRTRFSKPAKVLATRVLVPWLGSRTKETESFSRGKIERLRQLALDGTEIELLVAKAGFKPDQRTKGIVKLKARDHQRLAKLQPGAISAITETEEGLVFYQIKTQIAPFERALTDATVQRELAAEILREKEELPEAKAHARKLAKVLGTSPAQIQQSAAEVRGSRVIGPARFAPFSDTIIPRIGNSDVAIQRIRALGEGDVTQPPVSIRQDYIVFKAIKWHAPSMEDWWNAAPNLWPDFLKRAKKQLLAAWLARRLPDESIRIDGKALSALEL